MKRTKRYNGEDDSQVSDDTTSDTTADASPASASSSTSAASSTPASFSAAFKAARASGDKTFTYNGKSYTTELASAKKSPTPAGSSSAPSRVLTPNRTGQPGGSVRPRGTGTVMQQGQGADIYGGSIESIKNAFKKDPSRKSFFDANDERIANLKKGGATKKMASGGSTSSASSRADGIAQRGKTKGRMC